MEHRKNEAITLPRDSKSKEKSWKMAIGERSERETEMLMKIKSRNEDQSLQNSQFLRVIRDLGGIQ